jgi:hypothetical protein
MPTKANKQTKRVSVKAAAKATTATVTPTHDTAAPAAPAKPSLADQRAERQALTDAAREHVAAFYNGASLTVHKHKAPKLADAIARIASPTHKIGGAASPRDESLLTLLAAHSDSNGAFDPSSPAISADLGVLSRLSSGGYITTDGVACTITDRGAEYARNIIKRATKAA